MVNIINGANDSMKEYVDVSLEVFNSKEKENLNP
jgi:hypothetical protein